VTLFNPTDQAKSRIENHPAGKICDAVWLPPLLIFILTLAIFFPGLKNDFVLWDDNANFLENFAYRGLGWSQLKWMFSTIYMGHYQPLSWLTLGFDYLVWGMNPFGYHLTSLLIHGANAVVFYILCVRLLSLSLSIGPTDFALRAGAFCAAVLFAVHPLRVESVAWVTERRDVLSGLFFLFTILCYVEAATAETKEGYRHWMILAATVYVLSLLSKAAGMTLPLVLLVLDVYPLKRLGGGRGRWFGATVQNVWREKVPFIVPAVVAAIIAAIAQTWAMKSFSEHGMVDRLAQALFGLAFYVWKTIAPFRLSPLYELPPKLNPGEWIYLVSGLLVLIATVILFLFRRRWPAGLAVWVYYAALVAPVSGIIQSGPQLVADRYSYLSCLGWAVLAGGGLALLWRRWFNSNRTALAGVATVIVVGLFGLGYLTRQQIQVWHDEDRIWSRVLELNPNSAVAHNAMGMLLQKQGRFQQAVEHHRRGIQIDPSHWEVHNNLANALTGAGRIEEATDEQREAVRLAPDSPIVRYELGLSLYKQGKVDEAIEYFRKTLELEPEYASAHYSLGRALAQKGRLAEAIKEYKEALKRDETLAVVYYDLGNAHFKLRQYLEAVEQYGRAVQVDPDYAVAYYNMGNALLKLGETDKAIELYRQAIQHDPKYLAAYSNLGNALEGRGRIKEAIAQYKRVIEINPRDAEGHYNLGNALLREKDYQAAGKHYRQAIEINPKYVEARTNLGWLLERDGKKDEAEGQYRKGLEVKPGYESAHFNLGMLLVERGDEKGAIEQFRRVIEINPRDAEAHYQLAISLAAVGNTDQAAREFQEALRIQPKFTRARQSLEQLLEARRKKTSDD
jgi:protein O-mannosyl-transferase